MLLLMVAGNLKYEAGETSGGMTLLPNFMKITVRRKSCGGRGGKVGKGAQKNMLIPLIFFFDKET
jgi:hypothetical protein